jgi:hypothetical protein
MILFDIIIGNLIILTAIFGLYMEGKILPKGMIQFYFAFIAIGLVELIMGYSL